MHENDTIISMGARRMRWAMLCQVTGYWGLGSYIQLAQMMSGRALPEQKAVLCVKRDIPLAGGAGH